MNWFKRSFIIEAGYPEVILLRYNPEGMTVLIDNVRYRCPGYYPTVVARLNALIRAKAWGKAKQLLRTIQCINEEKEKQDFQSQQAQLTLF